MWGCHFLILSSNALWRKFVKLDQWRLKLVYKGVSEGRRRRNVVHLRRLRCLQSARLGGTAPPLLFFRVVASAVRCHVFWHFALEGMQEKVVWGGRYERGNVRRKQKRLLLCSQNRCRVKAFFSSGRRVHKSSANGLGSTKQVCVYAFPSSCLRCTLSWYVFHLQ